MAPMTQAIADALVPYRTAVHHCGPDGRRHRGGAGAGHAEQRPDLERRPDLELLRGSNVLRNLSVAGALTGSYQNLDDTIGTG